MKFRNICVFILPLFVLTTESRSAFVLRGGLNLANMSFDPDLAPGIDKSARTGLSATIMGDFPLENPVMRSIIGLGYENKGVQISDSYGSGTLKFDYLVFPVLLSLGTPDTLANKNRFFFNFGIEPGFKVSAKAESGGRSATVSGVSDFDCSIAVELGGEFPISAKGVYLAPGGGFSYGLINTVDEGAGSAHNFVFKFFLGFKFDLNKPSYE